MRPAAPIGADHVGAVTDRAEDKPVVLALHYLFVTDTDSQPVAVGLPHSEGKALPALSPLDARLHDGEFVARGLHGLDSMLIDQLDVLMLELFGELVARRVPNAEIVDEGKQALLMLA